MTKFETLFNKEIRGASPDRFQYGVRIYRNWAQASSGTPQKTLKIAMPITVMRSLQLAQSIPAEIFCSGLKY